MLMDVRSRGYTMTEMLVAITILGVVLTYVFNTFLAQYETSFMVEQVTEVQESNRAISGLMERDVRAAGYMVPPAAAACGQDFTDRPDVLFLSDSNAILPVDELPSAISGTYLGATLTGTPTFGSSVDHGVDDVVIDGTATYGSADFQANGGAILVDLANPDRGVSCGVVTGVDAANDEVTVDLPALGSTVTNPPEYRLIPAIVYGVVTVSGVPELRRNGLPFVQNVEDLQIAFFFDSDGDGLVDLTPAPGEYLGISGNTYAANAVDGNELREISIALIARTSADDPSSVTNVGTGQWRFNRATNIAVDDKRRRRINMSGTRLRNVPL